MFNFRTTIIIGVQKKFNIGKILICFLFYFLLCLTPHNSPFTLKPAMVATRQSGYTYCTVVCNCASYVPSCCTHAFLRYLPAVPTLSYATCLLYPHFPTLHACCTRAFLRYLPAIPVLSYASTVCAGASLRRMTVSLLLHGA